MLMVTMQTGLTVSEWACSYLTRLSEHDVVTFRRAMCTHAELSLRLLQLLQDDAMLPLLTVVLLLKTMRISLRVHG